MRFERKYIAATAVAVSLALGIPQLAGAAPQPGRYDHYSVKVGVGEHRTVVMDLKGNILQIYSNTQHNIAPSAVLMNEDGQAMPMTPAIKLKYDEIMAQLGDNHIVIINRTQTPFADANADLLTADTSSQYAVQPTATAYFPDATPYTVSLP